MVKFENDKLGTNNVIVTVYEESSTKRLPCPQNNKIRDRSLNTRRSCGYYDRRAELLAQVHQLRNVGTHPVHQDPSPTKPAPNTKKKRKLLAPLRKIRLSLGRIFGESKKRWRYESIETQGYGRKYRLCCHPRKSSWDKFSKRFCRVLKQFSCFWKCNKFSKNEQELHQDMHARNVNS
ncbi:uncharacterized protein LOC141596887 [Silene latifolia]|uniref:uncharacterized protein LOC141596887 n=1 Tax=Silene latifolia TaxID=37657 RepID=UPI003D77D59C